MSVQSVRSVLDSQNIEGISIGDIINMLIGSPISEDSFECGVITFSGDNHNSTTARLVKYDKYDIVEVYVAHNGKPVPAENEPCHLTSAQLDSLRKCRQGKMFDYFLGYVKRLVERAIVEAFYCGSLTESEFHAYTPSFQLENNRRETERLLLDARDSIQTLFDDYVIRATEKPEGDTEEEFNRLFEAVEKIKKNVLIPPQ